MEMKDLSNSQLMLLTILISFVTSIATGIATVALLQQAPSEVIQPINKVIQQTVEKVVRVEAPKQKVLTEEEIRGLINKILNEKEPEVIVPPEGEIPIENNTDTIPTESNSTSNANQTENTAAARQAL